MCRPGPPARARDDEDAAVIAFVAVGRTRRDQLAHRGAREQIHAGAVHRVEHLGGDPDVGDDDVARVDLRRRQHERQLGSRERHGEAGFDGGTDRLGRVGRQT